MKFLVLLIFLIISSCGLFKPYNDLIRMGYDLKKDTIDIKPYEYLLLHKGYTPQHKILNPINKLDLKISIKGYENSDTIPINTLLNDFEVVLADTSAMLISGELNFRRQGYGSILLLGTQRKENCNLSFAYSEEKQKNLKKNDVLFFWNVVVLKNSVNYTIPSRKYNLK